MSDNSRDYSSGSSLKSIKDRLQNRQGFQADGLKKGISQISDKTKMIGTTLQSMLASKGDSSVYSKGVRELDDFGYEKYNIDDESEIFISRVPENAMFNDGEPQIIRATDGKFVGSAPEQTVASIDASAPVAEDFSNLFNNVRRGSSVETEYRATIGKINEDGSIDPKPIDSGFLSRMRSGSVNARAVHGIELEDDAPSEAAEDVPEPLQEVDAGADPVPVAEAESEEEDDVEEVFIEVPAEAAVAEEIIGAPKEATPMPSFFDRMTRVTVEKRNEFFVDDEPEPVAEAESVEEDDDYDWLEMDDADGEYFTEDEPIVEAPVEPVTMFTEVSDDVAEEITIEDEGIVGELAAEEPVMSLIEAPVEAEEPVAEVPVEALEEITIEDETEEADIDIPAEAVMAFMETPVETPEEITVEDETEEVDIDIPAEAVMAFMEAPVEETVIETIIEAPVETEEPVTEETIDIPAEEVVIETIIEASVEEEVAEAVETEEPVAEAPAPAVMTLPAIEIREPEGITGLKVEGSEESVESAVEPSIMATESLVSAVTSEAVPARISGITVDGEALPPLSDPVRKRPRTVRFRFSNGVLQNVDSEKVEPKEELRDPLA